MVWPVILDPGHAVDSELRLAKNCATLGNMSQEQSKIHHAGAFWHQHTTTYLGAQSGRNLEFVGMRSQIVHFPPFVLWNNFYF